MDSPQPPEPAADAVGSAVPIPLILVIGPTASGKTALAVALAKALDGEIVNADALAAYAEMDIGTAKPTASEQDGVPHHVLGVVAPEETCNLQRWLGLAEAAIADIDGRGRLAVVSGGSPLYIKSLLEGLSAGTPRDATIRAALEADYDRTGGAAMLARLAAIDPDYAAQRHANDRRRIVRALEVYACSGRPYSSFHTTDGVRRPDYRTLLLGLAWDKEALHQRINTRAKAMFEAGLVDEVQRLRGRLSSEARQGVGYKEVIGYLEGRYDRDHALYLVRRGTRLLAKHQATWFKRFSDIVWLAGDAPDLVAQAVDLTRSFLSAETRAGGS